MDEIIVFMKARQEAEDHGETEFVCPICGGNAGLRN